MIQTDALGESQEIAHLDMGHYFGEVCETRLSLDVDHKLGAETYAPPCDGGLFCHAFVCVAKCIFTSDIKYSGGKLHLVWRRARGLQLGAPTTERGPNHQTKNANADSERSSRHDAHDQKRVKMFGILG